jgi:ribulose-phosphate 3-epimerase
MYLLSPSLLSADFARLGDDIKTVEQHNVKYLHVDVMDGVFVNNISIGVPVVKSIRAVTDLVLDVHLMIINPEKYIDAFAEAGADIINIHIEACSCCEDTLKHIRAIGKKAAITIKPKTSWTELKPLLPLVDMVLVMSVEPGFGGQSFIESTLDNVKGLAEYKLEAGLSYDIEIDGGINAENINKPLEAGANIIVAGSAVFKGDAGANADKLQAVINEYNV